MEFLQGFLKLEFIWILIGLFLILVEIVMPGLIIFFFAVGAFITGAVCILCEISINIQLVIFLVTSVVSLALLRKHLKKIFLGKVSQNIIDEFDVDEFEGKTAIVKDDIKSGEIGKVEFHGSDWNAQAHEDVQAGQRVVITGQEGLKLKIKRG